MNELQKNVPVLLDAAQKAGEAGSVITLPCQGGAWEVGALATSTKRFRSTSDALGTGRGAGQHVVVGRPLAAVEGWHGINLNQSSAQQKFWGKIAWLHLRQCLALIRRGSWTAGASLVLSRANHRVDTVPLH